MSWGCLAVGIGGARRWVLGRERGHWDLCGTRRSVEVGCRSAPPISHAIRSSDKFTTSRKPRNFNDPISKFERVVGELHAKLGWGRCFLRFRGVIEAGRPQAAGTTQNNPLKTNGPKKPDPSRPSSKLLAVIKAVGRHGDEERSRLEVSIWDFGSRNFARRAPRY